MILRVATVQPALLDGDVEHNQAVVEAGIRRAAQEGAQWVGLPEMWPTSFVTDDPDDRAGWLARTDAALAHVAELSRELDLVVFGSSFAAGEEGQRLRNRLTVFDAGSVVLRYDKVHLFSPTGEREAFSAGDAPPETVEVRGVRVSGAVCYDLRFGGLLQTPWRDGAEVLLVPAQWPAMRSTHWRALVLGRAAEHQSFVLGVNRSGTMEIGRRGTVLRYAGNSVIGAPDGTSRGEGDESGAPLVRDIDLDEVHSLRRDVPVRRDARDGIYFR